ncbi:phosphocholine-specific phospholipase C [Pseudopedobacter beijingensis]|uniref:phospholipase C n=1 Tax=Pseudopedobacter beijingensis TaxID=1207056 RepID=A0ABW4IFN2_9SPHI
MDNRREFLRKSILLSGAAGMASVLPISIQKAMAIDPEPGSTFLDAEHIVILMQENRSFDHCLGTLSGVRGFNDPRAVNLPDGKPVWYQTNALGHTYAPFRLNIKDSKITWMGSLPHSRQSQVDAYNGGKYDKWLIAKRPGNKNYREMPLTLGYFTREDLPFHYAMADAFTVCDQNFCSAMTSTTPNRSFFWSGKITNTEKGRLKANIRNTDFGYAKQRWKTFPELLQDNGINWGFYQSDLSCGGDYVGDERSWFANFGCNNLEHFEAYKVKFREGNIRSYEKQIDKLPKEIEALENRTPKNQEDAYKIQAAIKNKQKALENAKAQLEVWNRENWEKLDARSKELYKRAFIINDSDPNHRALEKHTYKDGNEKREMVIPKGDLFYQFRKDVKAGKLPTVSWLAGPKNFSDHPSAPWYGAWYVSEVLDILTQNPEVWKKTIFIVTYDENDGYYDHIPPFSIPDNNKPETGKLSAGIDSEVEHVRLENELAQGVPKKEAREAPIGLGFRVPMYIASPWSRGGKVCSEVFDHTSTLQFLEQFVNRKYKKNIRLENISEWRRTICGDLTSVFSPFDPKDKTLPFLNRNQFVESIYSAQFKNEPKDFIKLTDIDINNVKKGKALSGFTHVQEKGNRKSCAIPYQLDAPASLNAAKDTFGISFSAAKDVFGEKSAGAPFTVYAPSVFKDEAGQNAPYKNWSFAVKAGDIISYNFPLAAFENKEYHLRLHGPNGFFREFKGNEHDPILSVSIQPEINKLTKKASDKAIITLSNKGKTDVNISIKDISYNTLKPIDTLVMANSNKVVIIDLSKTQGWYDLEVSASKNSAYKQRLAGRVENGKESITDPLIGKA